jgi:calcium-binding protein CML
VLFQHFDTDGDGAITLAEFKSAMKRQNPKMADKEIEAMMKRLDTNGDGNIDFREFAAMEIFKQFDVDNDGEITIAEFKNGMSKLNPSLSEKEVKFYFSQMDVDGDGTISFKEFDCLWRSDMLAEKYPEPYKPI